MGRFVHKLVKEKFVLGSTEQQLRLLIEQLPIEIPIKNRQILKVVPFV